MMGNRIVPSTTIKIPCPPVGSPQDGRGTTAKNKAPLLCRVKHALGIISPSRLSYCEICDFGFAPNRIECEWCRELVRHPTPKIKDIYGLDGTVYFKDQDGQGWTGHPVAGCFDEWD